MDMVTAIPYALFLLACYALAWSVLRVACKAVAVTVTAIVKSATREGTVNWNFKVELWVAPLAFTYIMGYIFIL